MNRSILIKLSSFQYIDHVIKKMRSHDGLISKPGIASPEKTIVILKSSLIRRTMPWRNLSCSFIPFQLQWHSPTKNSARQMASLNVRPHPATCSVLLPRRPDEVLSSHRGYCGLYRASISTPHCWILLSICLAMRLIWNMVIVLMVSRCQDAAIQLSSRKRIGIHACQIASSVNGKL